MNVNIRQREIIQRTVLPISVRSLAISFPYLLLSRRTFLSLGTCLQELIPSACRYRREREYFVEVEHDSDGSDGASPFRLRTGTKPGETPRVNVNERKSVLPSFPRRTTAARSRRAISRKAEESLGHDVFASFSNRQNHAERVDGP